MRVAVLLQNGHQSRVIALCVALLFAAAVPASKAAALYKWVDENGAVHYSSQLPPDQSKKQHQKLNSQGVVMSTSEEKMVKSEEELAREAEEARKLEEEAAEEARLQAIKDHQDRVLLMTFSNEEEILHARDNRIQVIDSVIRLIESSIETTQKKLDQLQQRADEAYTSQGKEVPGGLAQKIEHFDRKIASREQQLATKNAEKEKIRAKYDLDLERFRELQASKD